MDLVFHILIPFALLYVLQIRVERRMIPFFLILSVLPDLDRFLLQRHALFHNILFPLAFAVLAYILTRKRGFTLLSGYFILSHLILDTGNFISYLYPFDTTFYSIELSLKLKNLLPVISYSLSKASVVEQGVGNVITTQGFAVILILSGLLVFLKFRKL